MLFWDTRSAITHIANASGMDTWYPSDPEQRTRCHEALYLHKQWLSPMLEQTLLAPAMGWTKAVIDDATRSKATAELRSVAFPRILLLLERSGGPLIGGAYPCIGDLVVGLSLMAAQLKMPTLDIWTASIVQYTLTAKAKLRGWASYMADKEVLFGGYRLQAQYPSWPQALEFSKDATLGQLLDALTEGSKLPVGDMAIKCG
jgi:glutathione S-transferase